jgi:hypothetical protein
MGDAGLALAGTAFPVSMWIVAGAAGALVGLALTFKR